jgi:hypothetical protein
LNYRAFFEGSGQVAHFFENCLRHSFVIVQRGTRMARLHEAAVGSVGVACLMCAHGLRAQVA